MAVNKPMMINDPIRKTVEAAIRIALLFLLLYWCYAIVKPFIDILIWAIIFGVALYPMFNWLQKRLGSRKILSSIIIVVLMFLVLALPGLLFAKSLYEGVAFVRENYETAGNLIPEASEKVATWPLIGPFLYEKWNVISKNLGATLTEYSPQIKQVLVGLVTSVASAGLAFIKLIISILVSGLLLVYSEKASGLTYRIFSRIIGEKGLEIAGIAEKTIRTVIKGILGVSFIQAILFGIGMIIAGVPAAGLWFILALLFSIIQVGIFPVSIPVIIYVIVTKSTGVVIFFLIWSIVVSLIDNILRPIFLGHGSGVPMAVIFIGSIGGFMYSGLAGLFTGAVVFSVGYRLFLFWLYEVKSEDEGI